MSDEERTRWNSRYESLNSVVESPHPLLPKLRRFLPTGGLLLDAGGGTGRNAIWAAKQGFEVTLADISRNGIRLAKRNAETAEVTLSTWCVDLDRAFGDQASDGQGTVDQGTVDQGTVDQGTADQDAVDQDAVETTWDVILCANFLQPSLIDSLSCWLVPGGVFVMIHPTYENLTRHKKPSRRYLTSTDEMKARLAEHELLHLEAGWSADGRHEMTLVVRRRPLI